MVRRSGECVWGWCLWKTSLDHGHDGFQSGRRDIACRSKIEHGELTKISSLLRAILASTVTPFPPGRRNSSADNTDRYAKYLANEISKQPGTISAQYIPQ